MDSRYVHSGIAALDNVVQGLRLGDNVVWQVEGLDDYLVFVEPFITQALADDRQCIYMRFAPHPPVLSPKSGLEVVEVDPGDGFDVFSSRVHDIIDKRGKEAFYVFDSLSSLVEEWATDEQLANFFQVTCPFLYELDTVAYFALMRGQHKHNAIARIRDTTQLLLDVYHARNSMYVHPQKVWDRYSPQMFLPQQVSSGEWSAVSQSGEAAAVSASARRPLLGGTASTIAPWESVYRKLSEYHAIDDTQRQHMPEFIALRHELTRMMLGDDPEYTTLANRYLSLDDLFAIRERVIGSGRVGGKTAGMLLARAILLKEPGTVDFAQTLDAHDSFYVGSDVFFTFLVDNDLFRLRLSLARSGEITWDEFADVEQRFLAGTFPPEIIEQFRATLDYYGQAPIIARSSSFLEDGFGNAFAGKYRSEFCPNQGTPDDRLDAFLHAVKLIYASALNPDAISYRRNRGLSETDEQMAILVQRVSGNLHDHHFFPTLAGVAFSRNLYAWNDRIDPTRGIIRLVLGLGTRAVDRVGGDYPRMIAVSHPQLRPEIGPRIAKYSQHHIDTLDLQTNQLTTTPIPHLLTHTQPPELHYLVSTLTHDGILDPITRHIDTPPDHLVLTFNKLIARTPFVAILGTMLTTLETAYGHPVDTEFTASITPDGHIHIDLLQCRPMAIPGATAPVPLPADIPPGRTLCRSTHIVGGGVIPNIRYILYIDPHRYAQAPTDTKKALGRIVGRINQHPLIANSKLAMLGPGRWGSSNIDLGVNVGYADIDHAALLVEIAHEEAGHTPEVSYGTHFFQDLVEARIIYLAVYPGQPDAEFNTQFLHTAPNILPQLLPDAAPHAPLIRLIDIPAATPGLHLHIVADAQHQRALCYLQ